MRKLLFLALLAIVFSCNKNKTESKTETTSTSTTSVDTSLSNEKSVEAAPAPAELKIAFVKIDTVLENYTFYKTIKGNLTAKGKKIQAEIEARTKVMQEEYMGYQAKGQSMSPKQMQDAEASLRKKDTELKAYQEKKSGELMKEEDSLNKQLQRKIENFLVGYAKENGYTYILSKHNGGSVLYGPKDLDVTQDVIAKLNAAK